MDNCTVLNRSRSISPRPSSQTALIAGDLNGETVRSSLKSSSTTLFVSSITGHELAEGFVQERGSEIHPIFPPPSSYESQRAQVRPPRRKWTGNLTTQTDHFCRVILAYRGTTQADALPDNFDIQKTHTWDEVFRAADLAKTKANHDTSRSMWGKIGRSTQAIAPVVIPTLDMIPNSNETSALCGGLKIVFNVATRMKDKRSMIMESFQSLPVTIRRAEDHLDDFPDDQDLQDAATELYIAVLRAIEGMIRWLVGTSTWEKIGNTLNQSLSDQPFNKALSDVQDHTGKVQHRLDKLQSQTTVRTDANVKNIKYGVESVGMHVRNTESMTRAMYPVITDTHSGFVAMNSKIDRQQEAYDGLVTFLQERLKNSECFRIMDERRHRKEAQKRERELALVNKELQALKVKKEAYRSSRALSPAWTPSPQFALTQGALMSILDVPSQIIGYDLQKVIKQGSRSKTSSQSRGHWLLRKGRFQIWLTSAEAKGLLVNGNCNAAEKVSAMSFVCAMLSQSLKEMPSAITVSYFCGLNTSSKDSQSGAAALLGSLTQQLLECQDFELEFIDVNYGEQLQNHNLEHLIDLFRRLVEQLPDDTILFCMIDGITFYEKRNYGDEIRAVIKMLHELTVDPDLAPIFKLLVTSPLLSRSAKEYFPAEERIVVPINAGDGQHLTMGQVKRQTNKRTASEVERSHDVTRSEDDLELGSSEESGLDKGNFSASAEEDD